MCVSVLGIFVFGEIAWNTWNSTRFPNERTRLADHGGCSMCALFQAAGADRAVALGVCCVLSVYSTRAPGGNMGTLQVLVSNDLLSVMNAKRGNRALSRYVAEILYSAEGVEPPPDGRCRPRKLDALLTALANGENVTPSPQSSVGDRNAYSALHSLRLVEWAGTKLVLTAKGREELQNR